MNIFFRHDFDPASKVIGLLYELVDSLATDEEPDIVLELGQQILSNLNTHYMSFAPEFQSALDAMNEIFDAKTNEEPALEKIEDYLIELVNKIKKTEENIFKFIPDILESYWSEYSTNDYSAKSLAIAIQRDSEAASENVYEEIDDEERQERAKKIIIASEKVYETIVQSPRPITRDVLRISIGQCSDQAIDIAASRKGILNYHGEYVCIDALRLSEKDIVCENFFYCLNMPFFFTGITVVQSAIAAIDDEMVVPFKRSNNLINFPHLFFRHRNHSQSCSLRLPQA